MNFKTWIKGSWTLINIYYNPALIFLFSNIHRCRELNFLRFNTFSKPEPLTQGPRNSYLG